MDKLSFSILSYALCGLLLAVPPAMAAKAPASKAMATPAYTARHAWPAENFTGKIIAVKPDQKLLVVNGPDGVPYDMVVTARTRIRHDNRVISLKDLSQLQNDAVSVRFIPERRGDVAEWIRVGG